MRTSEGKLEQVSRSLFAAQRDIGKLKLTKTKTVRVQTQKGSYEYAYLPLDQMHEKIRPILDKYELAVPQEVTEGPRGVFITTTILHVSGEWIELGPTPMPANGDAKSYGSAITYGLRYALCAALGIAPSEDDDGASARVEPAPVPPSKGSSGGQSKGGGKAKAGDGATSGDDGSLGKEQSETRGSTDTVSGETGEGSAVRSLPITDEQKATLRERFGARRSLEKARELYAGEDPKDGGIRVVPNIGALTADEAWEVIKLLSAETEEG